MDRKSLSGLVKKLKTEEKSLEWLVERARKNQGSEAKEPTEPSTSATILSLAFSRVRASATSLYQAVCNCLACEQHQKHALMIRLEQRIPDGNDRTASSSPIIFRLCVPVDAAGLQKIKIVSRENDSLPAKPVVGFLTRRVSSYLVSSACDRGSLTKSAAILQQWRLALVLLSL